MRKQFLFLLSISSLIALTGCGVSLPLSSVSSETTGMSLSSADLTSVSDTSVFSYDSGTSHVQYTVTFVTNATASLDPLVTSLIETMPMVENGTLTLEGWYFDSALTEKANFPLFVDHDMTLYAHWVEVSPGFIYKPSLDGLSYVVESYVGNGTNLTIAGTYNGKPVTEIGEYLFYNNEAITAVNLPPQLTRIGMAAFKNATSLTTIRFPDGVTDIGTDAFSGCSSLATITFSSSLVTIGNNAFDFCNALTSIDLPSTLTEIRSRSFGSTGLVTVILRGVTPPLRFANSFEDTPPNMTYRVPEAAVNIYKSHADWTAFSSQIVGY